MSRLVVLVDNQAEKPLMRAWGLSIYAELGGAKILFDTGPSPRALAHNAEALNIDLGQIDLIVISHMHGDHTGGLSLMAGRGIPIYVPGPGLSEGEAQTLRKWGFSVARVYETTPVAKDVYVVKPLRGPPWEEALAIASGGGITLLVGCSHPGVDRIAAQAVGDVGLRLRTVIGGFHLLGASERVVGGVLSRLVALGAEEIYPIHCSGDRARAVLRRMYPERFREGAAGTEIPL